MEKYKIDKVVLLPINARSSEGFTIPSNETVHELVEMHPEKFLGFASIDPHKIDRAVRELLNDLQLAGLKLSPLLQRFDPNDRRYMKKHRTLKYQYYSIVVFTWHHKSKISLSHPMKYEEIAVEFPDLKIILAHMGWLWVVESVSLAIKYKNVYLDISNVYTGH